MADGAGAARWSSSLGNRQRLWASQDMSYLTEGDTYMRTGFYLDRKALRYTSLSQHLFLIANVVTTSKALVTTSVAPFLHLI